MKALVTGGSGFLGHHIVRELLKNNIDTIVIDQKKPSYTLDVEHYSADLEYIKGDICDDALLNNAMKGCELVFHTAAIADIDEARKIPLKTMEVNVLGTVNCLEAAKNHGVKRFLFSSSVYVSGNRGSFYRVSKQTGESLCKTYYQESGLEYTILRYGSLYGREPNHWNFMYGLCKSLLTTGAYTYTSSPDAVREYIHINDAARETVRIASSPDYINKAVLITGHQRLKMHEFFAMIEEIMGKKITIKYVPEEKQRHYKMTPYSFEIEVPLRTNLSTYIDISEGIIDCLREVQKELSEHNQD